ncbi:MAG: hypothetical protein IKA97_04450 [Clostridia bacterium]|nr:hypothetical protein [Clostridia bacterium]
MTRGWSKKERENLIKLVAKYKAKDIPLKQCFSDFAKQSGRKKDSVRNFYYSYLQTLDYVPFGIEKKDVIVFTQKEVRELVCNMLRLLANGNSVRGAICKLTGDKKKRLRYQNKFRTLVKRKSPVVLEEMEKQKKSLRYYDPFLKQVIRIERAGEPITLVKTGDLEIKQNVKDYFNKEQNLALSKLLISENGV